jgi:mannose-6-phosphate isomerase
MSQTPFLAAEKLQCGVQHYEWGKCASSSAVASLLHREHEGSQKFAELWMGAHPSLPSHVVVADDDRSSRTVLLPDFLAAHPEFVSEAHRNHSAFGGTVPFLLKVLSIAKALSIQAHPNKVLAAQLHALDPTSYRDPNHKPELIVALTPFEGLCSFRTVQDLTQFVESIPPLHDLLRTCSTLPASAAAAAALSKDEERCVLRDVMTTLYTATPKEVMSQSLRTHTEALQRARDAAEHRSGPDLRAEDVVFLRLVEDFPSDVGCWMVYVLNLVHLNPGEGLFLRDSEPHAYLSGDGMEVMATSDNVVRAGLTPKFIDVNTLLSMLTYNSGGLAEAFRPAQEFPEGGGVVVQRYCPTADFPDFSLYRVALRRVGTAPAATSIVLPTFGIGIVLTGGVAVNGRTASRGDVLLVTPNVSITLEEGSEESSLFIASTNDL